jgi:peptide chain release factor 1
MNQEQSLREEYTALQARLEDPTIYSSKDYPKLARRMSELEKVIGLYDEKLNLQSKLAEAQEMTDISDPELAELARGEIIDLQAELSQNEQALSDALLPKDVNDERDCIIEIRAAAGGDEASLFAGDLYRMYSRWCETHGYKTELISESPSEAGGFKEIIFMVRGHSTLRDESSGSDSKSDSPYKILKFEAGVHRVQRIPVTESQGRIHTSTVTVAVLPEAEETDIEIKPEDIRVDVFRASGEIDDLIEKLQAAELQMLKNES